MIAIKLGILMAIHTLARNQDFQYWVLKSIVIEIVSLSNCMHSINNSWYSLFSKGLILGGFNNDKNISVVLRTKTNVQQDTEFHTDNQMKC